MKPTRNDSDIISVARGTVKARKGRFVIYDYDWLLNHLEQEFALQKEVRKKARKIRAALLGKEDNR